MGAGLTGPIGALTYWFPKMTGHMFNDRAGYVSFWLVQIGFNVTFTGIFAVGLPDNPDGCTPTPTSSPSGNSSQRWAPTASASAC